MKIISLGILFCCFTSTIAAQKDSTNSEVWAQDPEINLSGFVDVYYVYDFDKPTSGYRHPFLYNHNRHNEFNVNLGFVKLNVDHIKYRANLALHAGTYVEDNYASEPGMLKNFSEANIGISISKKNKLWLDVGILPSHIGFESAISMDNTVLTRSLLAENSPYFMAGAKITYKPNTKWELAAMALNGWQRIKRVSGNSLISGGSQIKFCPSDKLTLNWSTFVGTDHPDVARRMRYFNNFYAQIQIKKRVNLIAGFDIGFQQAQKHSSDYEHWFSPVVIAQYSFSDKWKMAVRAEYYRDLERNIIPVVTLYGFEMLGASLNLDFAPSKNILCRVEGRWLGSDDPYSPFYPSWEDSQNFFIGTSIAMKFAGKLSK